MGRMIAKNFPGSQLFPKLSVLFPAADELQGGIHGQAGPGENPRRDIVDQEKAKDLTWIWWAVPGTLVRSSPAAIFCGKPRKSLASAADLW